MATNIEIGNKVYNISDGTAQRAINVINADGIRNFVDGYWSIDKCGKQNGMANKHGEILLKTIKVDPSELGNHFNKTHCSFRNSDTYNINEILSLAKLDDILSNNYIDYAMNVTTTYPSIGRGEFLFVSLFKNLGFAKKAGDLVDLDNDELIEVKGIKATIGNGFNKNFKTLNKSIIKSILDKANIKDMTPNSLTIEYVRELKSKIGKDKDLLKFVFTALQNINKEYEPLSTNATEIYLKHGKFLTTLAALHLYIYTKIQKISHLIALNDTKFRFFEAPNTLSEAYDIMENFKISGWYIGDSGVKVTLK